MTNTNRPRKRDTMSDLERIVYEMAETGALTPARARLYPRPVGKLVRAGLLDRATLRPASEEVPAPSYSPVTRHTPPPPPPTPRPSEPPMVTLVVRVPPAWVDALDARAAEAGEDRSAAAREALAQGIGRLGHGSGVRRAAG